MEYEIQYARLATTEKLPDRFLNTQIKESADLGKAQMGQIFSFIEIVTPWFPTAQIGQTIINTFSNSYYQGGSTSDLVNFEESLKQVNESLAQITQNGETDWIGNLNGILGVIVENKMHIAQTGKAEVYVFREGKINHLTYGLAQGNAEPHPLKTFSNITSGELKSQDKILIANPELYKNFTIESLRQIITLNSPPEAVLQIAKILKKQKIATVNVLIINLLSREETAKQPLTENETIYLDRPLEPIWSGVQRLWQQIFYPILKFFAHSSRKAGKESIEFTKNYLATLKEKKKEGSVIKKRDLFEQEFLTSNREDGLLKDEEINYSPGPAVHDYSKKEPSAPQSENKFRRALRIVLDNLKKAGNFFLKLARNPKTRPYFFVGVAIIILIILGFIINARRNSAETKVNLNEAQTILREAEAAAKEGKQAVLSNDEEKAKKLLAEAIDKALKIENYPIVSASAKDVLNLSYTELDKLTSTTRYENLSPLLSIDETAQAVFVLNGQAFLVSKDKIYRSLLSGGKPEKVASTPKNNGDFQFGTVIDKNIFLYTSSQKVYEFQTDTQKIDLAKMDKNTWETANATTSYIGNIYLLDGIVGQIYKHASSKDSFDAGETYINSSSIDIKNSVSLAVDGSLYVLRGNAEVMKFQKGKLQDFEIKDIPTPYSKIEKPVKIITDTDTPSIYILDGGKNRILEFDKDGHFIHQYGLPSNLNDLNDFVVSVKSKKIWVLNAGDLYEIAI